MGASVHPRSRRAALGCVVLATIAMAGACAGERKSEVEHPIREAYALMDQGHNAKAVILLERVVSTDPDNSEARVLLASAYLGQAGVDVYELHRTFQDVLFAKPLEK